MKCIELDMDGIRYFVTVKNIMTTTEYYNPALRIELFVNSLRSNSIYTETINGTPRYFTKKNAKKFVIRALGVQPTKTE